MIIRASNEPEKPVYVLVRQCMLMYGTESVT